MSFMRIQGFVLRIVAMGIVMLAFGIGGCSDDSTTADDESLEFAPSSCIETEPATGPFQVLLSVNPGQTLIPIKIYRDEIEDNILVLEEVVRTTSVTYSLPTEHTYSAIAYYVVGLDTIGVLDADRISTNSEEYRDKFCWTVSGGIADLVLRVRP
jgi:hypothetical protein